MTHLCGIGLTGKLGGGGGGICGISPEIDGLSTFLWGVNDYWKISFNGSPLSTGCAKMTNIVCHWNDDLWKRHLKRNTHRQCKIEWLQFWEFCSLADKIPILFELQRNVIEWQKNWTFWKFVIQNGDTLNGDYIP